MFAALPGLFFACIFLALSRGRPVADPRDRLLSAAILSGVPVTAVTEALSLFRVLGLESLAMCWALAAIVAALLTLRSVPTIKCVRPKLGSLPPLS